MGFNFVGLLLMAIGGEELYQTSDLNAYQVRQVNSNGEVDKGSVVREHTVYALTTLGEIITTVKVEEFHLKKEGKNFNPLTEEFCESIVYGINIKSNKEVLSKMAVSEMAIDSIVKHDFIHLGARTFNIINEGLKMSILDTLKQNT